MSVVTTADIIVKNIKLGIFEFKVVNGLYDESSAQMLADYADVATGLANALTGTSFAKSSVVSSFASSAVDAYNLFNIKNPSEDPLYDTKVQSFIANAAGLLVNGYELLSPDFSY
ncbi:MAG: hypothetical protein HLX50_11300 [Alteromonadaceae bacterium]|nr:hypothetical protein [Alteromonadaceae bacterium]